MRYQYRPPVTPPPKPRAAKPAPAAPPTLAKARPVRLSDYIGRTVRCGLPPRLYKITASGELFGVYFCDALEVRPLPSAQSVQSCTVSSAPRERRLCTGTAEECVHWIQRHLLR